MRSMRIVSSSNRRAVARAAVGDADSRSRHRARGGGDRRPRAARRRCGAEALRARARRPDRIDRGAAARVGNARRATLPPRGARGDRAGGAAHPIGVEAAGAERLAASRSLPGITVEQRVIPLSRVGCYVPAGRYPLPSSLLMTAIPARAAGVGEVIVCCPRPDAAVFAAAIEAGVDRLFQRRRRARDRGDGLRHRARCRASTRSSAPAIAGSSAAKSLISADCGIDFYAGPTEILIVTVVRPRRVDRRRSARAGRARSRRARGADHHQPRAGRARGRGSRAADAGDGPGAAIDRPPRRHHRLPQHRAKRSRSPTPPHPNTSSSEPNRSAGASSNAGAVFVGGWTAQVAGDYAIGSNHVLPTAGAARYRGGLNAADFVKLVSVQRADEARARGDRARRSRRWREPKASKPTRARLKSN